MDAHRLGDTFGRRKKKPRPKRPQRPPSNRRQRPVGRRPRFRLAAYVARRFEENPNLPTDSARIAFTIFLVAITLIAAHAAYRYWTTPEPRVAVPAGAR